MKLHFTLLIVLGTFFTNNLNGQSYTSWITGDTSDAVVSGFQGGIVLAGGGGDHDEAMKWMLERAAGGDVLILRASNSDGYNDYFYSELGISVNSVETIRFDGLQASNEPYIIRRIEEAEVLFFAGGDQYDYYTYWKDNAIEEAIQYCISTKQITIGGTSAGMAILGQAYYTPTDLGVYSSEALEDPYHPYMDIIGYNDFLQVPFLENTITDTHFDQRDRAGRLFTFMARLVIDQGFRSKGIAANEYTAICVDEAGLARCFGEYPAFEEDVVYFAQANCITPFIPEVCIPGQALQWIRDEQAVKVCRIPATPNGSNTFELTDWLSHTNGSWLDWSAMDENLTVKEGADSPDCETISATNTVTKEKIALFPNPAGDVIQIPGATLGSDYILFDFQGKVLKSGMLNRLEVDISDLEGGYYQIQINDKDIIHQASFIKI